MDSILTYLEGSLGAFLMIASAIIAIVNLHVRIPNLAFRDSWRWGVFTLLPLIGAVIYAPTHWRAARRPFLFGIVALIVAVFLFKARQLCCGPMVMRSDL